MSSIKMSQFFNGKRDQKLNLTGREAAVLEILERANGQFGSAEVLVHLNENILPPTKEGVIIDLLYEMLRKGLVSEGQLIWHPNGGRPRGSFEISDTGKTALKLMRSMAETLARPWVRIEAGRNDGSALKAPEPRVTTWEERNN